MKRTNLTNKKSIKTCKTLHCTDDDEFSKTILALYRNINIIL